LFRGGFLFVAILTVPLIAAASHPAGAFGAAMGTPILRWLGTQSYGIYLWHWPMFLVTRPDLDIPLRGWAAGIASLGLTFLAAEASYRWIEMPVRRGLLARWWAGVRSGSTVVRARAGALVTAVAVTAVLGLVALWSVPKVDSTTYLGGVTEVGAHELAPKEAPTDPGSNSGKGHTKSSGGSGKDNDAGSDLPFWQRRITAVGDSVLLGARAAIENRFPRVIVDASISRQPADIAERVRERIDVDRIGNVLILQTGTNGLPDAGGLDDFLGSLREMDLVVVMTVRSEVPWMDQSNAIIERTAQGKDNVVVADWARATVGHPQYLYKDGTHLTSAGQRAYARLIWTTMREAQAKGIGDER
jgi:hypothetical protein